MLSSSPRLVFQYDTWSEPCLSLIAWCSTSPLSLFCSQFPVSLYIPYLVVFSPDLVYFPWTWFIFPGPGLIISPALLCSAIRMFTCHRKYSTLVHCFISTLYSELHGLQSEINFVTTCHDHDTRSTLYHSVWSCPCVYRPFHCMYLHSPIISILLVSPPISERFIWSVFPYDFLICSVYDPSYSLFPSCYTY